MADITLSVSTAVLDRIKTAKGIADATEAKEWIIGLMKADVLNAEVDKAYKLADADIQTAREAQETAVEAVTEITIT